MQKFMATLFILFCILGTGFSFNLAAAQDSSQNCEPITPSNAANIEPLAVMQIDDPLYLTWALNSKSLVATSWTELTIVKLADFSFSSVPIGEADELYPYISLPAVSPDLTRVAYGYTSLYLYDLTTGEQQTLINFPPDPMERFPRIAFSPDGTLLTAATGLGDIYQWDAATGELVNQTNIDSRYVGVMLLYSWDSSKLIIPWGGVVTTFATDTLEFRQTTIPFDGDYPSTAGIALHPNNEIFAAVVDYDSKPESDLVFLNLTTQQAEGISHYSRAVSVAFSPDGRLLAASSRSNILLWDFDGKTHLDENQTPIVTLEGHRPSPLDISFSADMRYIASSSVEHGSNVNTNDNGTVIIWGICSDS